MPCIVNTSQCYHCCCKPIDSQAPRWGQYANMQDRPMLPATRDEVGRRRLTDGRVTCASPLSVRRCVSGEATSDDHSITDMAAETITTTTQNASVAEDDVRTQDQDHTGMMLNGPSGRILSCRHQACVSQGARRSGRQRYFHHDPSHRHLEDRLSFTGRTQSDCIATLRCMLNVRLLLHLISWGSLMP